MSKYDWFVNGGIDDVKSTSEKFFTVCMPTGSGKSAVIFKNIIEKINSSQSQKLIFNISEPILKLTQQTVNDLAEILTAFPFQYDFTIYYNSSDNGTNYQIDDGDYNCLKFSRIDDISTNKQINIVASCHKSLYKFIDKLPELKTAGFEIYNYIDEAHTISPTVSNDDTTKVDIDALCKQSDLVCMVSATPENEITKKVASYENNDYSCVIHYGIEEKAVDSIQLNKIVPPEAQYMVIPDGASLEASLLEKYIEDLKVNNTKIKHKILVTLRSVKELNEVKIQLEKDGYKVFSICCEGIYGVNANDATIMDFIHEVEDYNDDCFVLHIRILIAGIDIKGLTDCILLNTDHGSFEAARHIIQTIGRCMRPLNGERDLPKSKRLKKHANVLFCIPESNIEGLAFVKRLINDYYGFNFPIFNKQYSVTLCNKSCETLFLPIRLDVPSDLNGNETIETVLMSAVDDIINEWREYAEELLKGNNSLKKTAINQLIKACDAAEMNFGGGYYKTTAEWLTDNNIRTKLYERIGKVVIGKDLLAAIRELKK